MIKVLIADDENMICELIRILLDWEALGIELAAVAHDGETALSLAKEIRPGIIITDIRMPGIDGLTLIERIQEFLPETKFIIISGYKEFDYAVRAIRYGVSDYLLKPIQKQQLNDTVRQLCRHIAGGAEESAEDGEQRIVRSTGNVDRIKTKLLLQAVCRPIQVLESVQPHGEPSQGMLVILFRYDTKTVFGDVDYTKQIEILSSKTAAEILTCCERKNIQAVVHQHERDTYFLVNIHSKRSEILNMFTKKFYEAQPQISFYSELALTMGIGSVVSSVNELYAAVDSARMAAMERFDKGLGQIFSYKDVRLQAREVYENSCALIDEEAQNIVALTHFQKIDKLEDVWERIYDNISELNPGYFVLCGERLVEKVIAISRQFQVSKQMSSMMHDNILAILSHCSSRTSFWEILTEQLTRYLVDHCKPLERKLSKSIAEAIAYIDSHYMEPITLNDVAAHCHTNPTYLSTKFKNELGVNLIRYLSEVRIEMAKLLLTTSTYSLVEISDMVGFGDPKHFSKQFRKMTGLAPSEFRKITS